MTSQTKHVYTIGSKKGLGFVYTQEESAGVVCLRVKLGIVESVVLGAEMPFSSRERHAGDEGEREGEESVRCRLARKGSR